jgi:aspartyl-tRNA(Asn)/glutamyl-tRNA(Gln) amidotransferase subunit C
MITSEQTKHIAKLARLAVTDEEIASFTKQIDAVLSYVEKLDTVDTAGIEPTAYVANRRDSLRNDEARNSLTQERLLENAPSVKGGCFAVPHVMGR